MKCLSLWQPWASLIAYGLKLHETRSWGTSHRGQLAIHAAKTKRGWDEADPALFGPLFAAAHFSGAPCETIDDFPHGALVAVVTLNSVVRINAEVAASVPGTHPIRRDEHPLARAKGAKVLASFDLLAGDWTVGRYAWRCELARRLKPPLIVPGAQGLFDFELSPDAEAALQYAEGDGFAARILEPFECTIESTLRALRASDPHRYQASRSQEHHT